MSNSSTTRPFVLIVYDRDQDKLDLVRGPYEDPMLAHQDATSYVQMTADEDLSGYDLPEGSDLSPEEKVEIIIWRDAWAEALMPLRGNPPVTITYDAYRVCTSYIEPGTAFVSGIGFRQTDIQPAQVNEDSTALTAEVLGQVIANAETHPQQTCGIAAKLPPVVKIVCWKCLHTSGYVVITGKYFLCPNCKTRNLFPDWIK